MHEAFQEQAAAKSAPKIGGVWKLNTQLSDPPRVPGQSDGGPNPVEGSGRRGGGGMVPGGGVGGMGRGGGGVPVGGQRGEGPGRGIDPEKLKAARALIEELLTAPAMLTVADADGSVSFTEADGRTRTYKTDNRKEKHQATNATVETRARWEEGSLVIETDLGNGLKATQTYSVGADPASTDRPHQARRRPRPHVPPAPPAPDRLRRRDPGRPTIGRRSVNETPPDYRWRREVNGERAPGGEYECVSGYGHACVVRGSLESGPGDAIDRLFAAGGIAHGLPGGPINGPQAFRPVFTAFRGAFPDIHFDIERTVVDGELVAVHCRVSGTHTGATLGVAPTGGRRLILAAWLSPESPGGSSRKAGIALTS